MNSLAVVVALLWTATGPGWANGGENFPFHVGEKLTYQIYWGPFVAGRAVLSVDGIEQVDGHDCYHLIALASTTGLADFMFHVDSKTESWLDVAELFTRRYRENRNEGKHTRSNETRFDYIGKLASSTNFISGRTKTARLDGPAQDVVSSLYYVRTQPLAIDLENNFPLIVGASNYTVNVRPDLRKTLWLGPLGDVPALRMEPHPTLTIVAANKGRMWFWISDDEHRFPVLLTSDMKIGRARFVLSHVEIANPVAAKGLRVQAAGRDH